MSANLSAQKQRIEMRLIPSRGKIIVKRDEAEKTTPGGILIPDVAKRKTNRARVLSVGECCIDDNGNEIPMSIKEGDIVCFNSLCGAEVEFENEKFLVLHQADILATVE